MFSKSHTVSALQPVLSRYPKLATRSFGEDQVTLLHLVCRYRSSVNWDDAGAIDCYRQLLSQGADPSAKDAAGRTHFG